MIIQMTPALYGLLALALLGSVAFAIVLNYCITLKKALAAMRVEFVELEKQLQVATAGAFGMGQRIVALEAKMKKLSQEQASHTNNSDDFAFAQAIQLFDQGADVDTVVSSCGLSSSEASLMALVRQRSSQKTFSELES